MLGYATQVALARMYGPSQLGLYILGFTVVQIAKILAQFGMDNGLVRYVAHYQAEENVRRVRGTILLALLVGLTLSLALSGLMFFGANFMARIFADGASNEPLFETVFRAFSVAIPFFTLMSVVLWATQGFQTVKYVTYVEQILQPLMNLGFIVLFYYAGAQVLGAVASYIVSMAVSLALALYYLSRLFPQLLDRRIVPEFESRAFLSASGPMVVASFTPYINTWPVIVVLGAFSTTDEVGIYNVAARTAAFSTLVLFAFAGIFTPMIASLYRQALLDDLGRLYKDVSRWIFTGSLAIFLCTVFLARDLMAVFGDAFVSGWPALVVIAGAELFNCSVGPTDRMLAMTGHQGIVVLVTSGAAVGALICGVVLVPLYGALGAAAATAIGIAVTNAVALLAVRKTIRFWPYSRQYFKPLAAGLLTIFMMLFLRALLPLPQGIPTIVVLGPCLLVGFAACNLLFGLSPSDRQLIESFWASIRGTRENDA